VTFRVGDRVSWCYWSGEVHRETYGRRMGTVTAVDVQPHRVVVSARRDDNGRVASHVPGNRRSGGLVLVSVVDQLGELVS